MGRNMGPRMRLLPESEKKMTSPPSQAASCAFTLLLTLFATAFANCPCPAGFLDQGYKAAHGRHHYDRLGIVVCRQIDKQIVAEQVLQGEPGVGAHLDHDAEEQADCQGEH